MLEWQQKMNIEDGASMAVEKLQGQPETIAYLAETLACYIPAVDRAKLSANIASIENATRH
jgi:hypothetical protein